MKKVHVEKETFIWSPKTGSNLTFTRDKKGNLVITAQDLKVTVKSKDDAYYWLETNNEVS